MSFCSASAWVRLTTSGTFCGPREIETLTSVSRGTDSPAVGSVFTTVPFGWSDSTGWKIGFRWASCSSEAACFFGSPIT